MANVQIIPETPAQFSTKIQSPDPQRTLGLGPTGVIHKPKFPDNKAFWGIRPECCGNWAFGVTSLLNSWTTLRPHATCCHS